MIKTYALIDMDGNIVNTIILDKEVSEWECPKGLALLEFQTDLGIGKNIADELIPKKY